MLAAACDEQTEAWVVALCKAGAGDGRQPHSNAWADVLLRDGGADTARTAEAKPEYLAPERLEPEREQAPVLAPEAHGQAGRGRGNPFDEVLRRASTTPYPSPALCGAHPVYFSARSADRACSWILHLMRQVEEMERRILKTVEETKQVGASTLAKLHGQHEQLNSVAAAQVKVSKPAS